LRDRLDARGQGIGKVVIEDKAEMRARLEQSSPMGGGCNFVVDQLLFLG
jgi:hypothetical protein